MTGPAERRLPELMGAAEACEALGIPESSRGNLHRLAGLPDPVADLKSGKVWAAEDIREFARTRRTRRRSAG